MSKIFGDFENNSQINETARNLRESGEYEDLWILSQENDISEERAKQFFDGEVETIVDEPENSEESPEVKETEEPEDHPTDEQIEDESAIDKLKREIDASKESQVPAKPIAKHLLEKCEIDVGFCMLVEQKHKTLEKCFSYVYEQAKKSLKSTNGWLEDDDVYKMATDYYTLDDAEIEQQKAEEKKKADDDREKKSTENKAKAQAAKPTEAVVKPEAKPVSKNKKETLDQISLF